MGERQLYNILLATRVLNNNMDRDEFCQVLVRYLSVKQLERVSNMPHKYTDKCKYYDEYIRAAEMELMERTLLGKKKIELRID